MKVEIIFRSSNKPKRLKAKSVYTRDGWLYVRLAKSKDIIGYPPSVIFSMSYKHKKHRGSSDG